METPLPNRTLLTDITSYVVTSDSRVGVFHQAVSSKIADQYSETEFTVTDAVPHVFTNVGKAFSLRSAFPVLLKITQTGPIEVPVVNPEPINYTTGVITADNIVAGHPLIVMLADIDLPVQTTSVTVTIFNVATGETEQLTLVKNSGQFIGQMPTVFDASRGTDFDLSMNCSHGQTIRIYYQDQKTAAGQSENISKEIMVSSPFVDSEILMNEYLYVGRPVAVLVNDRDLTGNGFHEATVTNITTGEVEDITLIESVPGIFTFSLPTVDGNANVAADNDGVLCVMVGDTVQISVTDPNSSSNSTVTLTAVVRADAQTNGILTLPTNVSMDTNTKLVFFDYDLASSVYIDIAVSNVRTGEFEYVRCFERVIGSGTFEGTLVLTSAPSNAGDYVLNVALADTIRAAYVDVTPELGGPSLLVTRTATVVPATSEDGNNGGNNGNGGGVPDPDPVPDPVFVEQTVSFLVNGLFSINGSFNGTLEIRGTDSKPVHCALFHI